MLRIAGQMAGPNGMKFFCEHSWVAGGNFFLQFFSKNFCVQLPFLDNYKFYLTTGSLDQFRLRNMFRYALDVL